MTRWRRFAALAATVVLTLAGCAGELTTPGEPLRLLAVTMPNAYEGEAFEATLRPTGGLRPYLYAVVDGSLPPGIALEHGRLVGVPTEQGRFSFTVEVQDANLNRTVQRLELSVGPLPPPVLTIDVPTTELQRPTELRLRLESGRAWRGAQVLLEWDAETFELDAPSVRTAQRDVLAVWEVAPGRLRIDLATTGEPLSHAADLVRFTLTPTVAAPLALDLEVVSSAAGGVSERRVRLGVTSPSPRDDAFDPADDDVDLDDLELDDEFEFDDDLELDDDVDGDEP